VNYKTVPKEDYQEWFSDMHFKTEPFYHQYASLAFVLSERLNRIMYIHGIGTGKTLTALYLLQCWNPQQKTLIVCPNSVIKTWKDEIKKHTDFSYVVLSGTAGERLEKLHQNSQLCIINYEGLRTIFAIKTLVRKKVKGKWKQVPGYKPDLDKIKQYGFETLIVDECHALKETTSLQTKIIKLISDRVRYAITMTGTPISRTAIDLFGQYQIITDVLGKDFYNDFQKVYFYKPDFKYGWEPKSICSICGEMYSYKKSHLEKHKISLKEYRLKYGKDKTTEQVLLDIVSPYTFKYSREECTELPDKVFQTYNIDLTTEQQDAMERVINGIPFNELTKIQIDNHVHKLLQITSGFLLKNNEVVYVFKNNPKLNALSELMDQMERKFIVYHQYQYESTMIAELLKRKGIHGAFLNGLIKNKDDQIEDFLFNENCKCLVAHPKSGGVGLNLQCASTTIYYNNGFIGTILRDQSEGRIHRSGQKNQCLYIDLIAAGTVDEVLYASLKEKTDYVQALLDYFKQIKK
jgi:SNF2 family DNA or RNA helicase